MKKVFEIKEEVKIAQDGFDVFLEKGDKIKILKEYEDRFDRIPYTNIQEALTLIKNVGVRAVEIIRNGKKGVLEDVSYLGTKRMDFMKYGNSLIFQQGGFYSRIDIQDAQIFREIHHFSRSSGESETSAIVIVGREVTANLSLAR